MNNSIKIKETFTDLDTALTAAKEAGNWIFKGYENNIAGEKRSNKRCGVTEYFLTENADILYVVTFDGRKCLNKIELGCGLNNAPLAVAHQFDESFAIVPDFLISKSSTNTIKELCAKGFLLVDQSLAAELSA